MTTGSTTPYQMAAGATYVSKLRRHITNYNCDADRMGAAATVAATLNVVNNPFSVGVRVVGVDVRYQWVIVVASP